MNDPNKAINVNLSSLLSLQAELLRKKAEVTKAKSLQTPADQYVPPINRNGTLEYTEGKKDKKQDVNEKTHVIELEDSALLEKSQRVLQAKSKFYEQMKRTGGKLNSDDNCLVLFNRKRQEEGYESEDEPKQEVTRISASDSSDVSSDEEAENSENDWVEYTDCLGRTRKCLRDDLESAKRRDAQLAASMPERLDQSKPNWMLDTKGTDMDDEAPIGPLPPTNESIFSDGCSLISKHDEQRANWERKEIENLDKSDVHYQDVFFDEARQHGVGYYAFSTDEEERKRQQHELDAVRKQTIAEQKHRDTLRAQREKIIATRVLAAKNRQRARIGLPPLEEEEVAQAKPEQTETKAERRERKRAEKLKRKQDTAEKERELERQQHIRPWDKAKDGVAQKKKDTHADDEEEEWSYKPERLPMSQEQWNEQKRAERKTEFAPVPELKRSNFNSMPPPPTQLFDHNMPPPPTVTAPTSNPFAATTFSSYQSSKSNRQFHRRNVEEIAPTMSDAEADHTTTRQRAAIPPPANLDGDYRLPAKKSKSSGDLERSIEAGLRFLRNNCDKATMSTKSSWTAKADY